MQQKQIIWNSARKNYTQISIPEYLENNADEVRRVYLEFTDALLSRISVKNKNNKKLQGIEFETILDMLKLYQILRNMLKPFETY